MTGHLCDVTQAGTGLLLVPAGLCRGSQEHGHSSFPSLASAETSALGYTMEQPGETWA